MSIGQRSRRAIGIVALGLGLALGGAGVVAAQEAAPAPSADQLALGKKLYSEGGCHNCHGPKGQGGISIDFPRGPSLRTSGLDAEGMIEIIKCGIPGTRMPAWLKGAYTETECFGEPLGPAPSGTIVSGAFTLEEITALVDYIQTEFVQH